MCRLCHGETVNSLPRRGAYGARRRPLVRLGVWLIVAVIFPGAIGVSAPASRNKLDRLLAEYANLSTKFSADMRALAGFCEQQNFPEDASRIRQLALPVAEQRADIDALPEKLQPELRPGLPPIENEWRTRLRTLQQTYAQELFLLSRRAIMEEQPSQAFHWIREAAFQNPDHQQARKALGFVRYEDGWSTPFAAENLKKGFTWHDQYGWILRTQLERYERGERFFNGQWRSAAREAAIRSDFRHGWEVLTEHFEIRTNHSLERGVELGKALEDFHRFFVREFAAFFNTRQQMQALFNSGSSDLRGVGKRHVIHYYRTRNEYVATLKPRQSNIEVTNGLYLPGDRIAYFYDDPDHRDGNLETMFHEVTHQLLGESARSINQVGEDANFWIVEGIACYMESFSRNDGHFTVGDPLHTRMHWARVRLIEQDFYRPMQKFTALGRREFQFGFDTPTLEKCYSQVTGMVHFFLHAQGGAYREPFIMHLSQVYSPNKRVRDRAAGLDELTGVPFEELDRQYAEYIKALPSALDAAKTVQQ